MSVAVTTGELYVWYLFLVLVAWGLGNALHAWLARRCGASCDAPQTSMRLDYEAACKPWWAPPPWLFGVAWPGLYVLLSVTGFRLRLLGGAWTGSAATTPLTLYAITLGLLAVWPGIYTGLQRRWLGIAVHAAALAFSVALVVTAWAVDVAAAALVLPLVAWLAFALVLAIAMVRMQATAAAATASVALESVQVVGSAYDYGHARAAQNNQFYAPQHQQPLFGGGDTESEYAQPSTHTSAQAHLRAPARTPPPSQPSHAPASLQAQQQAQLQAQQRAMHAAQMAQQAQAQQRSAAPPITGAQLMALARTQAPASTASAVRAAAASAFLHPPIGGGGHFDRNAKLRF